MIIQDESNKSKIAILESSKNSTLEAKIKALINPNLKFKSFFPTKYEKNTVKVAIIAMGKRAVSSAKLWKNLKDDATIQKYNGGFSKKYSPFNFKVKKS